MVDRGWPVLRVLSGLVLMLGLLALGALAQDRFSDAAAAGTEVSGQVLLAPEFREPEPTATSSPSTTTIPATTTLTTESPPPALRTATLAFTGDALGHRGVVRQAAAYGASHELEYDFSPMFAQVEPYLAGADLAICHLETPLSPDNTSLSGYPTFNVPGDLAAALSTVGYDGCSTASNHSLDRRSSGVFDTLDVLDTAGIGHTGMARDHDERASTRIYDAAGIAVAHASYSYGFNGFSVPSDMPWLVNSIDVETITADATEARAAGADYVVVSLHWGIEYRSKPTEEQTGIADQLLASDDIDVLIGHHAHVVQPVGTSNGKPIVFGLGNFLSNQSANCCEIGAQDGVIMQVHIQENPDRTGFRSWLTYVPTRVDRSDFTIVPLSDALADDMLDSGERRVLEISRARTRERLTSLDAIDSGLFEAQPVAASDG